MGSNISKCGLQLMTRGGWKKEKKHQKQMKTGGMTLDIQEDVFEFPDEDESVISLSSWAERDETNPLPQSQNNFQIQSSERETIMTRYPDQPPHEEEAVVHRATPQGADGAAQSAVIPEGEAGERKGTAGENREENVVKDSQVEKEHHVETTWTASKLLSLLTEAPDPFNKPKDFHMWLCTVCLAYELRPAGVTKLLELVYGTEWKYIQQHFYIPGAVCDAPWLNADAAKHWLCTTSAESIAACAQQKADSAATNCSQSSNNERVESRRPNRLPLPVGGAGEALQPAVIPQERARRTEEKTEVKDIVRIITTTMEKLHQPRESKCCVGSVWSRSELWKLLTEAPDPLKRAEEFHSWLLKVCLAYELRPAAVKRLLELVYASEWENVQRTFYIPGGELDSPWPNTEAMNNWLYKSSVESIYQCALEKADWSNMSLCQQEPEESVTHFVERFEQAWASSMGVPLDYRRAMSTIFLVTHLQPHVGELYKLKCIGWEDFTFTRTKLGLSFMEQKGMFESEKKAKHLARQLKETGQLQLEAPPSSSHPRRVHRRGRCYYCNKLGHWERECRLKSWHFSQGHADTSTWVSTYNGYVG